MGRARPYVSSIGRGRLLGRSGPRAGEAISDGCNADAKGAAGIANETLGNSSTGALARARCTARCIARLTARSSWNLTSALVGCTLISTSSGSIPIRINTTGWRPTINSVWKHSSTTNGNVRC